MTVALDANILLRLTDTTAAHHPVVVSALDTLRTQGRPLRTFPQAVYEFWVVATRPVPSNGLGLSPAECDQTITNLLTAFPLLADTAGLFTEWRTLVATYACHGKVAHDARYIAAMRTHGITTLLTFNTADFARYPGLDILDPAAVTALPPSTTP